MRFWYRRHRADPSTLDSRTYREMLGHVIAPSAGGWCADCATLYGSPGATLCRSCGRPLEAVSFTLRPVDG